MNENDRDGLILDCIDRWWMIAQSEVDDIDGWRNDPAEKLFISPWEKPKHFWADTPIIASELQRRKLSAQPLLEVYHAVCLWHETHVADDLPHQSTLRANLEQARVLLQTLKVELLGTAVKLEPPATPTEERNCFCYEEWQRGQSYKEINAALRKHPEWDCYEDHKGVRSAILSWANSRVLTIRKGHGGRRKQDEKKVRK